MRRPSTWPRILTRYLDGRPILARRVGAVVRGWRWCRRKPLQAGLISALTLTLTASFAGITWSWREAIHQKELLSIAEERARPGRSSRRHQPVSDRGADQPRRAREQPADEPVTLSEVLDRAAAKVSTSFADQPKIEAEIQIAIGRAYHGLGEYLKSEFHYRSALALFDGLEQDDPAGRLEAASERAHLLTHLGRYDKAQPLLERTLPEARRNLGLARDLAEDRRIPRRSSPGPGHLEDAETLYRGYLAGRLSRPSSRCRHRLLRPFQPGQRLSAAGQVS